MVFLKLASVVGSCRYYFGEAFHSPLLKRCFFSVVEVSNLLRFLGRSSFYVVSFLGLSTFAGCLEVVQVVGGVCVFWVLNSFGVVGSFFFFGRLEYRLFSVFGC